MHREKSRVSEKKEVNATTSSSIPPQNLDKYPAGTSYPSSYMVIYYSSPTSHPYYPYGTSPTALSFLYAYCILFPGSLGLPSVSPYMLYNTNLPQLVIVRDTTATKSLDLKVDTSITKELPILTNSPVEIGNLTDYID